MNQLIPNNVPYIESREVAKMVGKRHDHLVRDIDGYIETMTHSPNLGNAVDTYFQPSFYSSIEGGKQYRCFFCTRKGCEMIAHKITGERGIQFTAAYIERFHEMEKTLTIPEFDSLSPQLQVLINMEMKQREQEARISALSGEIEGIRQIVAISPSTEWRKETNALISRIADKRGGQTYCKSVRGEIYQLFECRYQVNLSVRLRNKIERMKKEGVSRSKANMLNKLDVIGEEEKLINGYVSTVKEIAIKYGAA